jgi:hypothetical protein
MTLFGPIGADVRHPLHPSVLERLEAEAVSHLGEMKPYRPDQLKDHLEAREFYEENQAAASGSSPKE